MGEMNDFQSPVGANCVRPKMLALRIFCRGELAPPVTDTYRNRYLKHKPNVFRKQIAFPCEGRGTAIAVDE